MPEIPRIVALHWSLCQRSQARVPWRHDRCVRNSIRIFGGRTESKIWNLKVSAWKGGCRVHRTEAVELCGKRGQVVSEFRPRHRNRQDHPRLRRLCGCSWRAFHEVAVYCCDRSRRGCAKDRRARPVRKGFTCDRGGTLEDAYPCVLCRTATSAVRSVAIEGLQKMELRT